MVVRAARRISLPWVHDWHDVRQELRLTRSEQHPLFEGQHSPLLSLGIFPRVLGEPQADWPPTARVSGFPFLRDPARTLTPELADFLERGDAPVVFTLGTTAVNDPGQFYEVSAEAARNLGLRAVLVTGKNGTTGRDDSVIAVPWAPHDLLFSRSRAIVHQGGIGTLAEAMAAGKPMIMMPYAHDQADNSWRAQRLGIGEVVARRRYGVRTLRRALDRLLMSRTLPANCQRIQQAMALEDGAHCAATLILRTLDTPAQRWQVAGSGTM